MNIADRIQQLRKAKGLSQEELADKIGVSRQAVSKWESEQSIPDMDKIILLSDCFETTTDYLIKGIEPIKENEKKPDALIFALTGTMLNATGLIAALAIELTRQTPLSLAIGFIIMIMGTGIFKVGQIINSSRKQHAKQLFFTVNIWILTFMPFALLANAAAGIIKGFSPLLSPIPEIESSFTAVFIFVATYLTVCLVTDISIIAKAKRHR